MAKMNPGFLNLKKSYLFIEIGKRVREYIAAHPDNKIIKMGIGDVTQPLAPVVVEAMKKAADEMGVKETFRGYEDSGKGYDFLREAVAGYYKSFGVTVSPEEVLISDGAKSDCGNIGDIFSENEALILGVLAVPVTVLWIVGITNSVNLIDGLDGLAVGVSTISSVTMFVVALLVAEGNVAVILAALMGACVGFMPYNLNPAKIFMGDTGALLLGYVLSTVSVVGMFKFYAIVTFIVPILALALPLFDTTCAFFRRLIHGQSPMHPDRGHLHHRLIDMGLSQKQAVAILYSISAILGLCAVVLATSGSVRLYLVIIAAASAVAVGIFIQRTLRGHKYHPPVDPTTCEPLEDKDVKA